MKTPHTHKDTHTHTHTPPKKYYAISKNCFEIKLSIKREKNKIQNIDEKAKYGLIPARYKL